MYNKHTEKLEQYTSSVFAVHTCMYTCVFAFWCDGEREKKVNTVFVAGCDVTACTAMVRCARNGILHIFLFRHAYGKRSPQCAPTKRVNHRIACTSHMYYYQMHTASVCVCGHNNHNH